MNRRPAVDRAVMAQVQALLARRDARPLPTGHTRPAPTLTAQADGTGSELLIYDEISYWGICAVDVAAALATVTGPLHVRINSPGGDVMDGIAIYNMIADYDGYVTVTVDGLAASAASFIAMAGDLVRVNRAGQMMIHDASGMCWGNTADMTAMAALLDMLSGTIASIYAARTGGDVNVWRDAMLANSGVGTWYTAETAVEAGLADEAVALAGGGTEPAPVDRSAGLFPYGTADQSGPWRLAALAPATGGTAVVGESGPEIVIPVGKVFGTADLVALVAEEVRRDQGIHTELITAEAPPAEGDTQNAAAAAQAPAQPAPAPPAAESQSLETEPDDWHQYTKDLTAEPSADDMLASLREA